MKKSKLIFLSIGACVLTLAAVFANRTNRKFGAVTTVYVKDPAGFCTFWAFATPSARLFTASGVQALLFKTCTSGSTWNAYATSSCTKHVYFVLDYNSNMKYLMANPSIGHFC